MRSRNAYRVADVATSLSGAVADARAVLGLNTAPLLTSGVCDAASIDLGTSAGLVHALGSDGAGEGSRGEEDGGVEHGDDDRLRVWRSGGGALVR